MNPGIYRNPDIFAVRLPGKCTYTRVTSYLIMCRKQETEADMIGMKLAARACFDPAGSASVFRKLGAEERRMGGGRVPAFLSTHPLSAKRVQQVMTNAQKVISTVVWFSVK
jgi:predicted Zn-dependent protease